MFYPLLAVTEQVAGGEAAKPAGAPELPNVITLLSHYFHDSPFIQFLHHWENVVFAFTVAIIISIVAWAATRNRGLLPGKLQNFLEMVVEGLDDFFAGILGPEGRKYTPFLGTLFIYIWCMNMFGLIPGMMSPTGGPNGINTTIALAVCVFLYVQYAGLRKQGIKGYVDHLMGSPRDTVQWILVPLNLPIHIIGELAKPLSLSLRLFGNITGEDVLLAAFVGLGVMAMSFMHSPVGIPLELPFIFLALLTGTIQALVFTLLSTVYFSMMLATHEEHAEHH
ncbi:MAG: F0F1 ATP synthase subunit A [candidate division Zixibacteria bacterium]|nr:F0F1 ATP synthase subunit A [candidate division Zixibacteria bacterium]